VDRILDIPEAAAYLRINEQTLRRLAREGVIPAFKVGRAWRFKSTSLDNWAETQQSAAQEAPRTHRILVVDDEARVRSFLEDLLALEGHEVVTASDGSEALPLLREKKADLVFLDLKMPRMNGPETLRGIREEFGPLPVIILTAYPESELVSEALPHSPVMLLSKPATPDQILSAVQQFLEGSSS
jgi:excisionase family DNA binding protein